MTLLMATFDLLSPELSVRVVVRRTTVKGKSDVLVAATAAVSGVPNT